MSRHRKRFFIAPSHISRGRVIITGTDARHIVKALRLGSGDTIRVVGDDGVSHMARIKKATPSAVECSLIARENRVAAREAGVTLAQAIPKGRTLELIIRKATELGVSTVVPIEAEKCVSRIEGEKAEQKLRRWQKLATDAAKQCSRYTVPQIMRVKSLSRFLKDHAEAELKIMLWEEEKTVGLKKALASGRGARSVNVLVGAEGGFTSREAEEARECGYITASMGPRIMRTDTASLALLSILMYELEEMEP